jgi:hypothetical protein
VQRQELGDRIADAGVVIDDEDGAGSDGSNSLTVLPIALV